MTESMRDMLRGVTVFPAGLPAFDTAAAPADPVTLFLTWFAYAVAAQVTGPHAMTLATADDAGVVSSRVLLCQDVDAAGRWSFASGAHSAKGRELARNPNAAATFYWPQLGRQVRVRGRAVPAGRAASAADFLARSPASRAEALTGRQSEPLAGPGELDAALRRAQAEIAADQDVVAKDWTLYALTAGDVEFWQADQDRRHVRLRYRRAGGGWTRELLWP